MFYPQLANVSIGMDAPWRIQLLGGLRAERGESVVTRFRTQKTALLLAYLAYYGRRAHSRETLIELLWPESDAELGRHNLSVALSWLRNQLEPPSAPGAALSSKTIASPSPSSSTPAIRPMSASFNRLAPATPRPCSACRSASTR